MARPTTSSSVYMANLEYGMDEKFVRKCFEDMGEKVVYVRVIRKMRPEGSSYAYCFVDFGNKEIASRVLRQYNNQPIPGMPNKRFRLNHCQGQGKSMANMQKSEFSIFVGDLSSDVDDLMLHDFFAERYSEVKGAKVVLDEHGASKGFGFIRFYNEEERNKAATEMQGTSGLGSKPLKLSVATPKSRAFEHGGAGSMRQNANSNPNPPSNYYGNQYQQQQYNSGQWNQQYENRGGGDYGNYYQNQSGGSGNDWSGPNYDPYYNYQNQGENPSDRDAASKTEKAAGKPVDYDPEDEFDFQHGQDPTDMTDIDANILKHFSGTFYEDLQRSRWHPVDTYTTVVGH